jgi:hypothetical protein
MSRRGPKTKKNRHRPRKHTAATRAWSPAARLGAVLGALLVVAVAGIAIFGRGGPNQTHVGDLGEPRHDDQAPSEAPGPIARGTLSDSAVVPLIGKPSWDELDNAEKDGWNTEVFTDKATRQLKQLGACILRLARGEELAVLDIANIAAERFECTPLRPARVNTIFKDNIFTIQRSVSSDDVNGPSASAQFHGTDGFVSALQELTGPFRDASQLRYKFKVFDVQASHGSISTRQYFSLFGRKPDGAISLNATFKMRWSAVASAAPRVSWIAVEQFEQVQNASPQGTLFSDCTEAALAENECYRGQLLYGFDYWLQRCQDNRYAAILGTPGIAIGDVNGDGRDDLYLCQEAGLANRLFIQDEDGTARDMSAWAGVDWLENSRSALLLDLDNDGDQDLAVAIVGGIVLASNNGQGQFRVRTVLDTNEDVMSLSAVDYDRDGRVDLYACVYYRDALPDDPTNTAIAAAAGRFVFYDSNEGGGNSLLRSEIGENGEIDEEGGWAFSDVTEQVGLDDNNRRLSFAAAWEDFDNDRDQDLYVANDFGTNNLYRNDGGRFTDVATEARVPDQSFGMSVAWADYDRNGLMDLYVSNMFSAAGNRVTRQPRFKPNTPVSVKDKFQYMARGNTLFQNSGDGSFRDVSVVAGVTMGRWAWSSTFADLNNDGWEDLVVANGYITTEDTGDL